MISSPGTLTLIDTLHGKVYDQGAIIRNVVSYYEISKE